MRLIAAPPVMGPCSVSTISHSNPAAAITSADSGLSNASHEPILTPPSFNFFFTLFSRTQQTMRLLTPFLFAACIVPASAANPPARLAPPSPFPRIVAQSVESEFIAPGMTRLDYRLATADGPLTIEVVAVDLHERGIRFGDVIATDRLISAGETVSSMAQRTHAVAGINADYFDIGQTNTPLGIVVHDGSLVRSPSRRVALEVDRDGTVHFTKFSFSGSARYGDATIPLTAVNEWPPQQGAALLTPAFGALPAITDATHD